MEIRDLIDAWELPEFFTDGEICAHIAADGDLHSPTVRGEPKRELPKSEARELFALELAGRQSTDLRHAHSRRPTDRR
jgi:hypothetical protein